MTSKCIEAIVSKQRVWENMGWDASGVNPCCQHPNPFQLTLKIYMNNMGVHDCSRLSMRGGVEGVNRVRIFMV